MSVLRAIAVFLCGFLSLRLCRAQIIGAGGCPRVEVKEGFNASQYLGRWYEAEKYFFIFEISGKCITADYFQKEEGLIGVMNAQISTLSGIKTEITGRAKQEIDDQNTAKFKVSFPTLPYYIEAPYWVLDTDYTNYSVVWSCLEFGLFHTVNIWILTREQIAPYQVMKSAYTVLDKNHINKGLLTKTNQRDCVYSQNM